MNHRLSRRNLLALTGGAALSAGLARAATGHAQSTSPQFTFLTGAELTFTDPWKLYDQNLLADIVPDSAALYSGETAEVALGFFDEPQKIDDVAKSLLELALGDPSLAQGIAGGGEGSVKPDGTSSSLEYRLYNLTVDDNVLGLYIQLVDGVEVGLLGAPMDDFAAQMTSAQESIQIDGVGVFGGAAADELQETLEGDTISGEFDDAAGLLNVTWREPWAELERNEEGIRLTNQDDPVVLYIATYPLNGASWEEMAKEDIAWLYDDQGADAKLVGPTVTDDGFSFVTDGQHGLRFVQGTATDSPDTYVLTFAADFAADIDIADAAKLVQGAQKTVKINGAPALKGVDELI